MYKLTTLMTGYPGRSTHHGGLGWSNVSLLRGNGQTVLVDTGGYGYRVPLRAALQGHGIREDEVTAVLLTHCHWDHASNYPLFPRASVFIGSAELDWATAQPIGTWEIPEFHVDALDRSAATQRLVEGDSPLPGIHVLPTPGHTPGHLAYVVDSEEGRLIFAGDAVKNEYELITGDADMTLDAAVSRDSIERVRAQLLADPDSRVICGHDRTLRITKSGTVEALTAIEAGMRIWRADAAERTVEFELQHP